MMNYPTVFIFVTCLAGCTLCILPEDSSDLDSYEKGISTNRERRSVTILYDIYTLDHFIELVERIERHTNTDKDTLKQIANYIRLLGYNDDLFNLLCGQVDPLPEGVLNTEEKRVLTQMMTYNFNKNTREEQGVVLTSDGETIAIGRVITGICAGLARDKSLSLTKWTSGAPLSVDNLYTATVAYNLAISALFNKNAASSTLFGPSGVWSNTDCPERYLLNSGIDTKATDAVILGDIDGFLLGHGIPSWDSKGVRLGQLLRMYYGSGILYDTSYASCRRKSKAKELVDTDDLLGQIEGFASAYYDKYSSQLTNVKQDDILSLAKNIAGKFFPYFDTIAGVVSCNMTDEADEDCEIPANIVFVMDESGSIKAHNYEKEKTFVRQIIEKFDISPIQSRVAIVEFATTALLSVALDNYGSKTRLMCAVRSLTYGRGFTRTAEALEVVYHNVLKPALDNPVVETETVQIVIVLTDGKSNDPDKNALQQIVKKLKKEIKDLTMIAIGVGSYDVSELKLIATDKNRHVFTANNFDQLLQLVTSLRKKACAAPVYIGMNFTNTEDSTEVVAYVSPNKARFFTISAEHFYGVKVIYVDVIPQYGTVSVYASRITDTPGPDNYTHKVEPTSEGDTMQIEFTDLCAGYNSSETCPPINIGIYGEGSSLACSERDCSLPNQIKFRIRRGTPPPSGVIKPGVHLFLQIVSFLIVTICFP